MSYQARREAEREPLLVSFLLISILNHDSLKSALTFNLANILATPSMIITQIIQIMSLCLETFDNARTRAATILLFSNEMQLGPTSEDGECVLSLGYFTRSRFL